MGHCFAESVWRFNVYIFFTVVFPTETRNRQLGKVLLKTQCDLLSDFVRFLVSEVMLRSIHLMPLIGSILS